MRQTIHVLLVRAPRRGLHKFTDDEGPDDMPAHLKSASMQVQLNVPILKGQLMFGTWLGI